MDTELPTNESDYELLFRSLFDDGRGFAFPCDAAGNVDMDVLSESARNNYFYARAVVGREYAMPRVRRCGRKGP